MSLKMIAGNTLVPRPYLKKWARWLAQLQEITQADAIWLMSLQGDRLQTVLDSGQPSLDQRTAASELANRLAEQAITARAVVEEYCAEVGCCCVSVPLCWPDASVYGALVLMAGKDGRSLLEWLRHMLESDFRTLHFVRAIDQHKNLLETRIAERTDDLRMANERLAQELSLTQRTAQLLRQMVIHVPGGDEHGYFHKLVQQLVQMLRAEHAFVALIDDQDPSRASTISCYSGNDWHANFNFEIAKTPCSHVHKRRGVFTSCDLDSEFPETQAQFGLQAETYLGVPLLDEAGCTLGVMAAMGGGDMLEAHLANEVIELLAARTGSEILRMHTEDELRHLALHDSLTGLPNRIHFRGRLEQAIAQAERAHTHLAVLFIDLDEFKTINDSLGHDVGDRVLVQASKLLEASMRDMDSVARLGGDEFAALLPGADSLEADAVFQRIAKAMSTPLLSEGIELFLSASVGCSLYPDDGTDSGSLLRSADTAMYRAKALGKNQLQFYAQHSKQTIQRDLVVGNRLRKAINAGELYVVYQPKIDLRDGSLVGAEALCRWHDQELGEVSPGEFIPIAERAGIISDLGALVIKQVIADLQEWQCQQIEVPKVAVNVSAKQLQTTEFTQWLAESVRSAGLKPHHLVIELTESVLMERNDINLPVLAELVACGFRISVDDFGTGYSSLAYLKRMPISEIKIDRSFVEHLADDQGDQAIAAAILTLGHTLEHVVVAEGIENEQQLRVLRALHCDVGQGFLFHRPLSRTAFRELLMHGRGGK